MNWNRFAFDLPLLRKELNEQAARRRTYIVRFVYASVLFMAAGAVFFGNFGGSTLGSLGQGRGMFEKLVLFTFGGICLVLPASLSGVLTVEKERNSLGLLLLTTLRPWEIILQKLFGRLVAMFSFLLLSLPLMAIAYSFGGVTQVSLFSSIFLLALSCLQIGSVSIMCSAYFRTTPAAFAGSYVILLAVYLVIPASFPPFAYGSTTDIGTREVIVYGTVMSATTISFLVSARAFLITRAFVPPRNRLLEFFRNLDAFFNRTNHLAGGIVLIKDADTLPKDEPIAWRETTKKSLGTFRYLFRVLVVLEFPVLWYCQLMNFPGPSGPDANRLNTLIYLLWGICPAIIAVHAVSVISAERSRQTLDVLLTTPLTGREIIRQKVRSLQRLIGVLLVPFLTIFLFKHFWFDLRVQDYLVWEIASVLIYLPLTAWFSVWLGLNIRSQTRAIMGGLTVIIVWVTLPLAVRYLLESTAGVDIPVIARYALILSPATVVPAIETLRPDLHGVPEPAHVFYILNFVFYGALFWYFRRQCLKNADKRLGRIAGAKATKT